MELRPSENINILHLLFGLNAIFAIPATTTGKPMHRLTVKPETSLVRPFVVAAVMRGVTFDAARFASFIDLQDKLHTNICRCVGLHMKRLLTREG